MSTATIEMVSLEGSGTKLTSQQLDNLDSRVEGSLLRHGKEDWDDAVLVCNGMVSAHRG
jgi:hypothetical protein